MDILVSHSNSLPSSPEYTFKGTFSLFQEQEPGFNFCNLISDSRKLFVFLLFSSIIINFAFSESVSCHLPVPHTFYVNCNVFKVIHLFSSKRSLQCLLTLTLAEDVSFFLYLENTVHCGKIKTGTRKYFYLQLDA